MLDSQTFFSTLTNTLVYLGPYTALGVGKNATEEEIRQAYRRLSVKYHPDKNPGDEQARKWFEAVTEAKDILLDPDKNARNHVYFKSYRKGGIDSSNSDAGRNPRGRGRRDPFDFEDFDDIFGGFEAEERRRQENQRRRREEEARRQAAERAERERQEKERQRKAKAEEAERLRREAQEREERRRRERTAELYRLVQEYRTVLAKMEATLNAPASERRAALEKARLECERLSERMLPFVDLNEYREVIAELEKQLDTIKDKASKLERSEENYRKLAEELRAEGILLGVWTNCSPEQLEKARVIIEKWKGQIPEEELKAYIDSINHLKEEKATEAEHANVGATPEAKKIIFDSLYGEALRIVAKTGRVSPAYLVEHLKNKGVDFARAERIIRKMEEDGFISSPDMKRGNSRKILVTTEQMEAFINTHEFTDPESATPNQASQQEKEESAQNEAEAKVAAEKARILEALLKEIEVSRETEERLAKKEEEILKRLAELDAEEATPEKSEDDVMEEIFAMPENTSKEINEKKDRLFKLLDDLSNEWEEKETEYNNTFFLRIPTRNKLGARMNQIVDFIQSINEELTSLNEKLHEVYAAESAEDQRRRETERARQEEAERQEAEQLEQKRVQAIEEDEKTNPFKHFLLKKMHDAAFWTLFQKTREEITLKDIDQVCGNDITGKDGKNICIITPKEITQERSNSAYLSSNGFSLQLQNVEEVQDEKGVHTDSPEARYRLVSPEWEYMDSEDDLTFAEGKELLERRAHEYQAKLRADFEKE